MLSNRHTGNLVSTMQTIALTVALACPLMMSARVDAQEKMPADGSDSVSQPENPGVVEKVSIRKVVSDQEIQSRLAEILQTTDWFEEVNVDVRNSVVFLDGTAPDEEHKEWTAQLARNTEGVAAVVNHIKVSKEVSLSQPLSSVATSLKALWEDFLGQSPLIVAGLLVLIVTAFANKIAHSIVSRVAERSRLRSSLRDLFLQLMTIGIWVVGLMVAAVIMFPGMTPAKILTVLGLGSVAVGFAFKDIFENFFAGILILWKYPFDKGDFIQCGDIKGRIEDITIRMSMIRQVDGQLVVVPNALLFKNPVDVLTNRPSRRTTVTCGVAYDADLNEAGRVIQQAVESCSSVEKDESVEIFAQEFADSSINFEVTWWTSATPLDIRESRDEVVRAVKQALDKAGIEIPFPQRTLWLPEPIRTLGNVDSTKI